MEHLEPAHVEGELQQGEHGHVGVILVARVALPAVQELTTQQTRRKERVHCQRHHLLTHTPNSYTCISTMAVDNLTEKITKNQCTQGKEAGSQHNCASTHQSTEEA